MKMIEASEPGREGHGQTRRRLEASRSVNRRYEFLVRACDDAHRRLSRGPRGEAGGAASSSPPTSGAPTAGRLPAVLDGIEGVVIAWPQEAPARARWIGWVGGARQLEGRRRHAFRVAAATDRGARATSTGPDPTESRFVEIASDISTCVVELYTLAGLEVADAGVAASPAYAVWGVGKGLQGP